MTRKNLSIAIPASVVSDTPHLREKTSKVGLIGRAAAIFSVDEIIIFPDIPHINQKAETELVALLLTYMETPQYLRKSLFKLNPDLQYVGVLPPLRTLHHPLNRRAMQLKMGEFREAVVLSRTKQGMFVDVGVERAIFVRDKDLPVGKRVTVKVVKTGRAVEAELANRHDVPSYWGYDVIVVKHPLGTFLEKSNFDLVIGTSRQGSLIGDVAEKLVEKWRGARNILVAFGAPSQGLNDIVGRDGYKLEDLVDFVVNTIPRQGTETVRTEEALVASLAVFNALAN